jgi:hypothetical protein
MAVTASRFGASQVSHATVVAAVPAERSGGTDLLAAAPRLFDFRGDRRMRQPPGMPVVWDR